MNELKILLEVFTFYIRCITCGCHSHYVDIFVGDYILFSSIAFGQFHRHLLSIHNQVLPVHSRRRDSAVSHQHTYIHMFSLEKIYIWAHRNVRKWKKIKNKPRKLTWCLLNIFLFFFVSFHSLVSVSFINSTD